MRSFLLSRQSVVAWGILALSLGATFAGWYVTRNGVEEGHGVRFEARMNSIARAIQDRMDIYALALRAGAAHFDASADVSRSEWHSYVERLDIARNYPGLQGMGFAAVVRSKDLMAHEAAMRQQGFADYRVWPDDQRALRSAIIYLEPFDWRNQRAFGYDMLSEPVRRAAMEASGDTGEPMLTGKVRLVQETKFEAQAGFLIYVPVYGGGKMPGTVEARRQALKGWVYSPFRADDLMRGIYGADPPDIHIRVYDGTATAPQDLLHDGAAAGSSLPAGKDPAYAGRLTITVASRPWTVAMSSLPAFEADIDRQKPRLVLIGGLLTSLLLFAATAAMAARRRSLVEAFDASQRSLEEKEVLLREIHHRVKNSLQIVVSMLTMQALKTLDDTVRGELNAAVSRVRAIAKIHEHLYGGSDVTQVDFGRYLTAICADFADSASEYVLRVKAASITLPTERAVPLALVFIELVTNAVKHAHAPLPRRAIDVGLARTAKGDLELTVRDYGVGLPEGFVLEKARSGLGMRTILALVLQLEASLDFESAEPGTRWRLRLPLGHAGAPSARPAPPVGPMGRSRGTERADRPRRLFVGDAEIGFQGRPVGLELGARALIGDTSSLKDDRAVGDVENLLRALLDDDRRQSLVAYDAAHRGQ